MSRTSDLRYIAISTANKMYGYLEDLKDILSELTMANDIDDCTKLALLECYVALPEPELLDELVARLGCIDIGEDE